MHPVLQKYDDLEIVSRDLTNASGFTLSALVHNEKHFLPPFLTHYRKLGVQRFVFIDDRSTDGTAAYLSAQPDVTLLKSHRKYGDKIEAKDAQALSLPISRMEVMWRMLLVEKFGLNQWSLHLDADEFLDLPEGLSIQDFTAKLDDTVDEFVWGAMIDMYPATVSDLAEMAGDPVIDLDKPWYFDGQQHLRIREGKTPKMRHAGSRARLLRKFDLNQKRSWIETKARKLLRLPSSRYNAIRKPVLLRWRSGQIFQSAHDVSGAASPHFLLPIRHYKFNGPIHDRIHRVTMTGGHPGGGAEYKDLARLLAAMSEKDESFLYVKSVRYTGFEDFRRTGNATGFNNMGVINRSGRST
jgi:hypothetical protein